MFLHAGASLHGHEYSPRAIAQQPAKRLPLLRSALRSLPDADSRITSSGSVSPEIRPRPVSFHASTSPAHRTTRPRPISDYIPKRELSVRFREPETDDELLQSDAPVSEDEGSMVSERSSDVSSRRQRKRAPRKSTQFLLAHPAPQLMTKQRHLVQIRPRLLLQMQEIGEKRLVPAFDIVPAHLLAGSLIIPRLARRCPRVFGAKANLGPNDLLIVRSEDYGTLEADDSLDQRDLVAIISPQGSGSDDTAEIFMEDGSIWEANIMANGSYEFTRLGDGGYVRTARWVKRAITPSAAARSVKSPTPPSSPTLPEYKWTFSMINPETRRHPIMGTLMSNTLDIFDSYSTMSTSSGRYPPTRPAGTDLSGSGDWFTTSRLTVMVPEDVKLLMAITAAWVNLRQEGWPASANPKFTQSLQRRNTGNGTQPRAQTFPARCNFTTTRSNPNRPSQVTINPVFDGLDNRRPETPVRRRTLSVCHGPSFVKKLIPPAFCGADRSMAQENGYFEEEKPRRRLSVRQWKNKLFHRRSSAQEQQEEYMKCKLEY